MSREHDQLSCELDVLEVIEDALGHDLGATDPDYTDHLEMILPDGAMVSIEVKVALP